MNAALIKVKDEPNKITGLLNTGNIADQETTHLINVHGITGMENLPMLKSDQLSQIVKAYNNSMPNTMFPIGISKQDRLAGLLWWAMDSKRKVRALDLTTFTADVTSESHTKFKDYPRRKDNTALCSLMELSKCVCCSCVVLMSTCSEYYD